MPHTKRTMIEGAIAATLGLILLGCLIADAFGQEEHPAFGPRHISQLSVESEVADIPKLEAKAVEILRRVGTVTGEAMTLAEARAYVRIDGKTNVARCLEIVITDRLRGIVQAKVTGVTVANQHPEAR